MGFIDYGDALSNALLSVHLDCGGMKKIYILLKK